MFALLRTNLLCLLIISTNAKLTWIFFPTWSLESISFTSIHTHFHTFKTKPLKYKPIFRRKLLQGPILFSASYAYIACIGEYPLNPRGSAVARRSGGNIGRDEKEETATTLSPILPFSVACLCVRLCLTRLESSSTSRDRLRSHHTFKPDQEPFLAGISYVIFSCLFFLPHRPNVCEHRIPVGIFRKCRKVPGKRRLQCRSVATATRHAHPGYTIPR